MLRYLIGIVLSFLVLTFVRAIMGAFQKAVVNEVKSAMGDEAPAAAAPRSGPAAPTAATTLRKCATCGTYKPESAMTRYGSGEKSVFFCLGDCEKKATA